MSTLKTNNIEHLDASSPSIQIGVGGGVVISGVVTATSFDGAISGSVTGDVNAGIVTTTTLLGVSTAGIGSVYDVDSINDLGYPTAGPLSNRNIVINGAMQVWQRTDSLDDTSVSDGFNEDYQTVDRFAFRFGNAADGGVGIARTTDVPANQGFSNAYKVGVETSVTPTTTMIIYPEYVVEAQDIRNSGWNYNDSSSYITVSFWVKSNKTGTYNLGAFTDDGTRQFFTNEYTINSSDTWERKEISIPGDAEIVFNNDSGVGLRLCWHLSIGPDRNDGTSGSWSSDSVNFSTPNQVNFMDDTANEWYLTGVQLEVGERATPFEHRSYGDTLLKCQRYFYKIESMLGLIMNAQSTRRALTDIWYPVTMRSTPDINSPSCDRYALPGESNISNTLQIDATYRFPDKTTIRWDDGLASEVFTAGLTYIMFPSSVNVPPEFDAEL